MRRAALPLLSALTLAACGGGGGGENATRPLPEAPEEITVRSTAFADGEAIPERFTCDGEGESPALSWSGVPRGARELVLVVDDPDAGYFVHWTVVGIPPDATGVEEGAALEEGTELANSLGDDGWTAPCPPEGDGTHEYLFAVYATRAPLSLPDDAAHDDVRAALEQHAIARGVLRATFGRG